ncbi:MAG: CDP-alcohol phosphatidyltransferase family protein [Actinomycetota bacterium]
MAERNVLLTIPNLLSLLRLCTVPVFLWLFVTNREEAAVIIYAAGAITDFFDGYIARRFNQVSEFGKLIDPLADRVFIVSLAVALVATGAMHWLLAFAIVARDLILLSAFPLFERRGVGRIPVNFTGKTATACLLFGLSWLAVGETDFGFSEAGEVVGQAFTLAGAILYYVAGGMYAVEAVRRLRALERTGERG